MKLEQWSGLLVTGTDTGIGKTWVSALIIEELRKKGVEAVGLKPVLSGSREDAERLWEASGGTLDLDVINPWWYQHRQPLSWLLGSKVRLWKLSPWWNTFTKYKAPTISLSLKGWVDGRFRWAKGSLLRTMQGLWAFL